MTEPLPEFPYHPDPVATGVVVPSGAACTCCGRERGYVYQGPVYAADELGGRLCPWCIADGSAAERFDAHVTSGACRGDDVSLEVFAAVDRRTPDFTARQEPQWFFHCAEGAVFLGRSGPPNSRPTRRRWRCFGERRADGAGRWSVCSRRSSSRPAPR
ncbi:CbrC family protein [Streptomyces sp. G45]|uniref:CbrC family protein n=1 Tax=Streptomyces sp. G45 TaxID=3406627 RepID=UPI003C132BAA